MVNEQDKTLEAIRIAIDMENDGKEYYQQASQESSNEVGRKLLQSLALEEDIHRQKFVEMSLVFQYIYLLVYVVPYFLNKILVLIQPIFTVSHTQMFNVISQLVLLIYIPQFFWLEI